MAARGAFLGAMLLAAALAPATAHAGLEPDGAGCDQACIDSLSQFADEYLEKRAPVFTAPPARFEVEAGQGAKACAARPQSGPAVFGVMLGPGDVDGFTTLSGPANDIELMTDVMRERGVPASMISVVQGKEATRDGMLKAMAAPLACLRERDQVVLVYSGWGTIYPYEWFSIGSMLRDYCSGTLDGARKATCEAALADNVEQSYLSTLSDIANALALQWVRRVQPLANMLPGERMHVLIGAGSRANDEGTLDLLDGVTAADISNYVSRIRNIGADVFLIIDTRLAASGDLVALQQQAAAPPSWAVYGNTMIEYGGFPPIQDEMNKRGPVPLFGTGEFAVFYASTPDGPAFEYRQGYDNTQLGALIFRVAEVLRGRTALTFRDMAMEISKSFAAHNKTNGGTQEQEPVFMASNIDLSLLAPRAGPARKATGEIEVISPTPKRGAAAVEEEVLTVVARYTGTDAARMAIIDGELVPVDDNGQFRGDVRDAGSKFTVALRVLGAKYETLATGELKLRDKPAEPVIATPARRLALVIANDTYDDPAFPQLATPMADAEEVARVLKQRFGFTTLLEGGDKPLDLFMRNATKSQILQILFDLRRRLTAEDQLLIYYAGHGESEPDLGSYWVPADGQAGADFTWIDAEEITRELRRMNAASVLVISDSCYAGGLSRSASEPAPEQAARERYLGKASRLKSRQLMASGGEEPVEDGGGGGHSVFAKALIDALNAMPEKTFTASELFEQKVKPAVISAANALTEGQTPGFSRIAKAGDEPGSEFVFQAVTATP